MSSTLLCLCPLLTCHTPYLQLALDTASPPSSVVPDTSQSRTLEVTIPSSSATSPGGVSPYDVSQLDETDMFGSRASSVTVIGEHDRQSLFSPFSSPVNQGSDTPIISIRPHPFSIRSGTTPLSMPSPSDYRKGSQSESDSVDSSSTHGQYEVGSNATLRAVKKTGCTSQSSDLSTSQCVHALLRKNSPLLLSARQADKAPDEDGQVTDHSNCHYGNRTTCATLACCESMGMCPIQDGFLTFDPSRNSGMVSNVKYPLCEAGDNEYSISHLATCGLLGPSHSPESNSSCSCAPPSHASCTSSLDSGYGYDQSWSLTDSSRNSCAEFTGSYSIKTHPPGNLVEVPNTVARCLCNENDSGHGSQYSCPRDKGCRRALHFADSSAQEGVAGQGCSASTRKCSSTSSPARTSHGLQDQASTAFRFPDASFAPHCGAGSRCRNAEAAVAKHLPSEERTIAHIDTDPMGSVFPVKPMRMNDLVDSTPTSSLLPERPTALVDTDPTSSVFPTKLSRYSKVALEELPSPPSPELVGEKQSDSSAMCDSPLGMFAVSSNPLAPLPPRKIKNHIRTITQTNASTGDVIRTSAQANASTSDVNDHIRTNAQAKASDGDVSLTSCDFVGLDNPTSVLYTSDSDLCTDSDNLLESALSATSLSAGLSETTSVSASVPRHFGSTFSTGSVPMSQGGRINGSSPLSLQHPLPPRVVVGDTPPSVTGSICSEVDSGRGTKSSLKTGEFDTYSLSQISEMSYEFEPDSAQESLNTLLRHRANFRANSSPPLFGTQPQLRCEDKEVCSMGGACRSYPMLFNPEENGRASHKLERCVMKEGVPDKREGMETRSFSEPPSSLQQQLNWHERSLMMGVRPSTLEQFDNFTDVPLPNMEDFHLDTPSTHLPLEDDVAAHRHHMSDFGHSLFVG